MGKLSWEMLFAQGSLFDLTAGVWSARVRLKPQDLGIEDTAEVRKAINMAYARLVPKEAIEKINRLIWDARKEVEQCSIPFPLVQGASFVPKDQREVLEQKLSELKTQFDGQVAIFLARYDEYKKEMEPVIRKALQDASHNGDSEKGVQRILSEYPPVEYIEHKFSFKWRAFAISAPIDGSIAGALESSTGDVKDALATMVGGLRDEAIKKVGEITDLIVRGGKYSAKTINAARRVIDRLHGMNVLGDKQLESALDKLNVVLSDYKGDGNVASFEEVKAELQKDLDKAAEAAAEKLMSLGKRGVRM